MICQRYHASVGHEDKRTVKRTQSIFTSWRLEIFHLQKPAGLGLKLPDNLGYCDALDVSRNCGIPAKETDRLKMHSTDHVEVFERKLDYRTQFVVIHAPDNGGNKRYPYSQTTAGFDCGEF